MPESLRGREQRARGRGASSFEEYVRQYTRPFAEAGRDQADELVPIEIPLVKDHNQMTMHELETDVSSVAPQDESEGIDVPSLAQDGEMRVGEWPEPGLEPDDTPHKPEEGERVGQGPEGDAQETGEPEHHAFRAELARAREELERLKAELLLSAQEQGGRAGQEAAREREEQQRASLVVVQEVAEDVYATKAELVRIEIEALREEEQRVLRDRESPLRERLEQADYIRLRLGQAEQEVAEIQQSTARRVAEAAQVVAELEGRDTVASLQRKVAHLDESVAALYTTVQERVDATASQGRRGRLGLWSAVVALLLVAAVGLAGILLPRRVGSISEAGAGAGDLRVHLAALYQSVGETDQAVRLLDEAVAAGIHDAQVLERAGWTYFVLGDNDQVIDLLAPALEKDAENDGIRMALARAYAAAGRSSEAVVAYDILIAKYPHQAPVYHRELAQMYRRNKNYAQALEQYQLALDAGASRTEAVLDIGEMHWVQGEAEKALAAFQQVVALDPNNYHAILRIGNYHQEKDDCQRAIYYYDQAITLGPDINWAYHSKGECHLALEQYTEAIEQFKLALERSKYAESYAEMGNAYVALDDCAQAIPAFEKALALWPDMPTARKGLEQCQE